MRTGTLVAVLLLLAAPVALGSHKNWPEFHVTYAELHQAPGTIVGGVDLNDHFVVNMRIVNTGIPHEDTIAINEWGHFNDLPLSVWHQEDVFLDTGESIDVTADVWLKMLPEWTRFAYGPLWYCTSVGSDWTGRCWSLMIVHGFPQNVYPENVPNWQFSSDQAYGDG